MNLQVHLKQTQDHFRYLLKAIYSVLFAKQRNSRTRSPVEIGNNTLLLFFFSQEKVSFLFHKASGNKELVPFGQDNCRM